MDQSNQKRPIEAPALALRALLQPRGIDVREVRTRLHMSQRQFAGLFGFPLPTLRHWERGNRRPSGTALVLLHVIRANPRAVLQAVRNARFRDPNCLAKMQHNKSSRAPPGFGGIHW